MRKMLLAAVPLAGALLLSIGSTVTATPNPAASTYGFDEVQWVWLKADLNADGVLSRDEVWEENASLATGFDAADLDGNGMLNAGEFEILLMSS